MRFTTFTVPAFTAVLAVSGCAAETSQDETENAADQDLTVSRLKGHWTSDAGPIYSIDFTTKNAHTLGGAVSGHEFTAQIDNGVRCLTTPCPSSDTVTGVYKSNGGKLTIVSYDKPTASFGRIIGDYTHALTNADGTLTVDKSDNTIHQTFSRTIPCGNTSCGAGTYCCNPLRGMCAKPGVLCIQ